MAEQRYRAVVLVISDGREVTEVAARFVPERPVELAREKAPTLVLPAWRPPGF